MKSKGLYLVLATAVISGVSIFINQYSVKVVNPYIFTGLKNIMVAVLLFGLIIILSQWKNLKKLNKKNWLTLVLIGLIGGSIPFLMFFKGLEMTSGPEASYIHKFLFVFIALLAPIFLKEYWRWHYIIGVAALVIGSILLFDINGLFQWQTGSLLIVGATFLWAVENMISKKAIAKISPQIVAWGRMFFGSIFIVAFWAYTEQLGSLATLELNQIYWVLLTAVLLFGYVTTWYTGLKYIPLTYAAAILALGAPITALLQLIQGKAFDTAQLAGMGIMFAGVILFIYLDRKICSRSKTQPVTQ
ncbi:DMT family transporter [Patescibacteria group bacterium]|nr:DMT family transporter [Patescibacteria group bacterium]MBU1673078.1 DMT family transporter [Patescibacteria group bacterium]MBU1963684.1 DMT family transporter [Patescibacteria group bacterium]